MCKCDFGWLGDGYCDVALGCNVSECGFDYGDCNMCVTSLVTLEGREGNPL